MIGLNQMTKLMHQHIIRAVWRELRQPNGQANGFGLGATTAPSGFHGVGRDAIGGFTDFFLPKGLAILDKLSEPKFINMA